MVFSSIIFLCMFLPVVMAAYFICPARFRNIILLVSSLFFYAWGEPIYILIMLFSTVFDYINGLLLERFEIRQKFRAHKAVIIISVVVNIGILCFFKYTDFIITNINELTGSAIGLLQIALPIGISFYTFQTLSYTIDVYRGKVKAQHNILDFATYISMFPQLIAGPIVRYSDVEKEIHSRTTNLTMVVQGTQRFLLGLGKKVLLANQIGAIWTEISSMGELNTSLAWLGALAYTFQIYFDFSGYSDMAVGLGKIMGFKFPENFIYPYQSKSITEFWRRWHITLSSWFREYLYIPLGGNRKGLPRQIFNLFIVWFLTGLWHGAGWTFITWGLYFFVILLLEKTFLLKLLDKCPVIIQHAYAVLLIVIGWVIFASPDLATAGTFLKAMFGIGVSAAGGMAGYMWRTHAVLIIVLAIGSTQLPKILWRVGLKKLFAKAKWRVLALNILCLAVLFASLAFLVGDTYNPFLYFRF